MTEKGAHGLKQLLCQLGFLQDNTHKDEQRNSHQYGVFHNAVNAKRHKGKHVRPFCINPKQQGHAAKGKGNWKAD